MTVSTATIEQLARDEAGAIEVDLPIGGRAGIAVIIGPISFWWRPGEWGTPAHKDYLEWRAAVCAALVKGGWLIYKPHAALQGPWDERAQAINDGAIRLADAVYDVTPPEIPINGTLKERDVARDAGRPLIACPPGDPAMLEYMAKTEAAYAAHHAAAASS
jgi:hypothetical protein